MRQAQHSSKQARSGQVGVGWWAKAVIGSGTRVLFDFLTGFWSGFKVRTVRPAAEGPVRSLNMDRETLSQAVEIPKTLFGNNPIVDLIELAKESKVGYTLGFGPNKAD